MLLAGTALILAELALRGFVYFAREPFERFDLGAGTFALVPGEHTGAYGSRVVVNARGFTGRPLEDRSELDQRFVAVGNSCTFGAGDGVHTYPDILSLRLRAEAAGRRSRKEVVNAAISGLDTRQVTRRVRSRVAGLEPDVVLIYTGWNDLMKKSPLGQGEASITSDLIDWADRLWLVRGARKLVFHQLRPAMAAPATGPGSRSGRFRYFSPARFRTDLDDLVRAVREIGAEPLLMTLPSPLRDDLTAEQLRAGHITFPSVAGTYGVGEFVDLLAAYNDAIRQVARERDVPLLDLAEGFADIPDAARYFHDTMHPNDLGMDVIARLLEASLEDHGLLGAPSVPAEPRPERPAEG